MVVGTQCPPIGGLNFVKGSPIAIGKPHADKPVVLVLEFWATWCPPCRDNIPHLTELQHKYKDRHVYIIGITSEQDVKKVEKFVASQGSAMDYTVAVDVGGEGQELVMAAGARGIPHAFIVDTTNTITFSGHPGDPAFAQQLERAASKAAPRAESAAKVLPPITESYEELMAKSVKELKTILADRKIDISGAVEKSDLAKLVVERASKVTYYQ